MCCTRLAANAGPKKVVNISVAINKLKASKSDGDVGLSSDYFKYSCNDLAVYISLLFTALLDHGTPPSEFATSTIIPIPKGKGLNPTDSANYRGIALSPIYGKLFDLVVLHKFSDLLCTSSMQFGFKAKRSTSMCTMVKEVITYRIFQTISHDFFQKFQGSGLHSGATYVRTFPKNHKLHTARYGVPRSALDHDQLTHSTPQSLTVSAAVWPPLPSRRVSLSLSVYAWCLIPMAVNRNAVRGGRLLHAPAERGKTPA